MQVSVENTNGLQRRMTVKIPSSSVHEKVESRLHDLSGQLRVDGFRPGKVPMKIVRQRYAKGVYEEVRNEVLRQSFQQAIEQEKLRLVGVPQLEDLAPVDGEHMKFTATFEVYPEFTPADVGQLNIIRPRAVVTDADVGKMMERLRQQRMIFTAVDRTAEEGDQVTMDFVGNIDGEEFAGGKGENTSFILGQGRMLKEFEEPLYGLKAGDKATIDVSFPQDYQAAHLQGKSAQFELLVKKIAVGALPPINEEFAHSFHAESVDDVRREMQLNMENELKQSINARLKQQVMDGLLAINAFALPESMVNKEVERMHKAESSQSSPKPPADVARKSAEYRVKLGLTVGEMIKLYGLKPEREMIESILDHLVAGHNNVPELKARYRSDQQTMANIENMALEQQIVDLVLHKAAVIDENSSYDELMNLQSKS